MVATPVDCTGEEMYIRDIKDRSILRAALMASADVLITGDKDFFESEILTPKIM
jgi:predicted nucleic acid-binding protein